MISVLYCVPVKQEALDIPSLSRGSKRSISGVSPPYAAPLSPKNLRTEAHPSEGASSSAHVYFGVEKGSDCLLCVSS